MATLMSPLFLFLITFFSSSQSSQAKLSYSDHCSGVPLSTFSSLSIDTTSHVHISGYFSGGDNFFGPDSDPSSNLTNSKEIYFSAGNIYRTKTPDVFHLSGHINLQTGSSSRSWMSSSRRYRNQMVIYGGGSGKWASLDMSGFWSKITGKMCLVGTGSMRSDKGTKLKLSAVFNLNYPNNSNIHSSIIGGTIENSNDVNSPHFDKISVLGYTQNNYEYTQIDRVKSICSRAKNSIELLRFNNLEASNYFQRFLYGQYRLEYRGDCSVSNCNIFSYKKSHEILPSFITLIQFYVNEDGKVHMLIDFSNSTGFRYNLMPNKSLVGEGYWDSEKNILCLLACPVIKTENPMKDSSVGECTIGLSFWFPAVFTIKDRSNVYGRIWSTKSKSDSSYFNPIPFRSLGGNVGVLPGVKYIYTQANSMRRACGETKDDDLRNGRFPDENSIEDLIFDLTVKDGNKTLQGYATPLSFEDNFYGDSISEIASDVSFLQKNHNFSDTLSNVSYSISYSLSDSDFRVVEVTDISAEGIYNSGLGKLCMVGCRSIRGKSEDSPDCEISINIQLSPLNQISDGHTNSTRHLNGTIRSTRNSSDPLYFETLELSSYTMYNTEAHEMISRMDIEIIMVTISLTLSCIFILFQLFHVKKHKDVLPSVSITMLVILTLGYMIPLVLNLEALFLKHRRKNYMLWAGGWLEANEVIVRTLSMVAFLLHFRLLQLAWASRSSEASKKSSWVPERKALRFCLPLYFAGALIAWFVHARSNKTQVVNLDYISTPSSSIWEDLTSYIGLILDGFLLPQIFLNVMSNSKDKALSPVFYVGIAAVRAMPHLYDAYRAHYYVPYFNSSYIYANPSGDYYSSVWNIIISSECVLFAVLIFLQQRFGGSCFLPRRFKKPGGYEAVPVISL